MEAKLVEGGSAMMRKKIGKDSDRGARMGDDVPSPETNKAQSEKGARMTSKGRRLHLGDPSGQNAGFD